MSNLDLLELAREKCLEIGAVEINCVNMSGNCTVIICEMENQNNFILAVTNKTIVLITSYVKVTRHFPIVECYDEVTYKVDAEEFLCS